MINKLTKSILQFLGYIPFTSLPPILQKYRRQIPFQRIQSYATFTALFLYVLQPMNFYISKASNFSEREESMFFFGNACLTVSSYSLFVLQKVKILRRVTDFEQMVEKSMWKGANGAYMDSSKMLYFAGSQLVLVNTVYTTAKANIVQFSKWFQCLIVDSMIFVYVGVHFAISLYRYIGSGFADSFTGNLVYPALCVSYEFKCRRE